MARRGLSTQEKIERAERHPKRPGEDCGAPPGQWIPVVNRAKCEGKADCTEVCPYDVFAVGTIAPEEFKTLPFVSRMKLRVHGMQTAYTPRADLCQACGLCVVACPEKAISLRRLNPESR